MTNLLFEQHETEQENKNILASFIKKNLSPLTEFHTIYAILIDRRWETDRDRKKMVDEGDFKYIHRYIHMCCFSLWLLLFHSCRCFFFYWYFLFVIFGRSLQVATWSASWYFWHRFWKLDFSAVVIIVVSFFFVSTNIYRSNN